MLDTMRVRSTRALVLGRRLWLAAQGLAVLAVVANAVLLPIHRSAAEHFDIIAVSTAAAQHVHHTAGSDTGDHRQDAAGAQVCHFCRLLGAVIPLPPTTVLAVLSDSERIQWPARENPAETLPPLRRANLPRAPPLSA